MRTFAFLACLALGACSRQEREKPRTEPWQNPAFQGAQQASATPSAAPATGDHYTLIASDVRFSLLAKEQTTRGRLGTLSGELSVARGNFGAAQATINVDLTSLSIDADADAGQQLAFTRRALEWLELGEQVSASVRERQKLARFELSSVERLVEGKSPGAWQGTAKGQLSLHGFRVPLEQPISFEQSGEKLVIRSQRPLVVKLAEHDLRPRNAEGQLVASELSLLGTRIGREARVDFELVFAAAPGKKSSKNRHLGRKLGFRLPKP